MKAAVWVCYFLAAVHIVMAVCLRDSLWLYADVVSAQVWIAAALIIGTARRR